MNLRLAMVAVTAALVLQTVQAVIPFGKQWLFGHSIKNGHLPAGTEVVAFEHSCQAPPCIITQIHVPSIYAGHGDGPILSARPPSLLY